MSVKGVPSWTSQTLELDADRSLHVVQAGEGPDVVLIHGALATHHDWLAGPAGAMTHDHRVTIIDRPGHGVSRRPRFAGTPREQAAQILAGLTALDIDQAIVVGHSFGALTSLAMAELRPERVAGLLLAAPLAFPEPRLIEHLFLAPRSLPVLGPFLSSLAEATRLDHMLLLAVQAQMFWPEPVPRLWRDTFPYHQVLNTAHMVAEGEDAAAILPMAPSATIAASTIDVPVRILTGSRDLIVEDEQQAKRLARIMPRAQLTEVAGAGHMLHHSHQQLVAEAVCALLAAA